VVIGIIFILMILAFFLFILIKRGLVNYSRKYLSLNWDEFNENIPSEDARLKYGISDYFGYYKSTTETKMTGALQWFWNEFYNMNGMSKSLSTVFSHPDVVIDGQIYEAKICRQYSIDRIKSPIISTIVSFVIVFLNYFLRDIIIALVKRIGFHTETNQTKVIMVFIFIVQFFNTAILNLLTNANLREAIGISVFSGIYPDFDFNWYIDFGVPMISTMLTNAFSPLIELWMFYPLTLLYRLLDKNFIWKKYRTKKTTIQQFVNLYSGPEYLLHYKYSRILNIVFVTFMYGMVLPILFPIGLLSIIFTYFAEKIMIVFYYKEPPSYDQKLNNLALKILAWAPFFMFTFGFWMMSNRQIFYNVAKLSEKANPKVENTGHVLFKDIRAGPELNLFIMIWLFLLCMIFRRLIAYLLNKSPFAVKVDQSLDEGLPNYFDALEYHSKYWIWEERHSRNNLGFKIILESNLEGIADSKIGNQCIQGVAVYEMLANVRYIEKFQYFPSHSNSDMEENLGDCDKWKISLNLAFIKHKHSSAVNFSDNPRHTAKNLRNTSKIHKIWTIQNTFSTDNH
jgi:hypothetical protein